MKTNSLKNSVLPSKGPDSSQHPEESVSESLLTDPLLVCCMALNRLARIANTNATTPSETGMLTTHCFLLYVAVSRIIYLLLYYTIYIMAHGAMSHPTI